MTIESLSPSPCAVATWNLGLSLRFVALHLHSSTLHPACLQLKQVSVTPEPRSPSFAAEKTFLISAAYAEIYFPIIVLVECSFPLYAHANTQYHNVILLFSVMNCSPGVPITGQVLANTITYVPSFYTLLCTNMYFSLLIQCSG